MTKKWTPDHCATVQSKATGALTSALLATLAICIGDEELVLVLRGQSRKFRLIDTWIRARYHNG